jgi:predicted transcriptional regulator
MAGSKAIAITELQFRVLRVLWDQGPQTVRELMEHLPRGDRQPYTTVLGLLQTMEKAGLVEHAKEGLTHRYRPSVSRQAATGSLLSDFLERFFHGSAEQLILGLVDAERIAPDDLRAIEARLARARGRVDAETAPLHARGPTKPTSPRKKP